MYEERTESRGGNEVKQLCSDFRLDAAKTRAKGWISTHLRPEIQEKFIKINRLRELVYSYCLNMSIHPYNPNPIYHVFVTESSTHNMAS